MRNVLQERATEQIEIQRQLRQGTGKIVRKKFGPVAKFLWPDKTAAFLAAIAKSDERTAARWRAGEHPPPYSIIEATMHEIFGD